VYQSVATSAETHHRRMERGVEAIQACLEVWLPGSTVEAAQRSSDGGASTFRILWGDGTLMLWVAAEVLELDAEGATSHLHRFRISRTLREEGAGKTIAVTTRGVSIRLRRRRRFFNVVG
jgi:hypothetical protein